MRRERIIYAVLFVLLGHFHMAYAISDTNLNAFDENGRKTGYWVVDGSMKPTKGYTSNQIIEEGEYESNRKVGLWKKYYPEGNIMSEITFKNNMPSGPYITYYRNGKIEEQSNWVNNKNVGAFKRFFPSGQIKQDFTFNEKGLRDGSQKYYYENGKPELIVSIKDGKEEGEMTRYFPNGDIKEKKAFNNGAIDESTIKKYEVIKPLVKIKETTTEPVILSKEVVDEKPNVYVFKNTGENTLYNKDKLISQSGYFKKGRLYNGKKYIYNEHGILTSIDIYKKGRLAGHGVIED